MAQVSWSPTALAAFSEIFEALQERSPAAASRLEARVEALTARLAAFPQSGRVARELADSRFREAVIAPYVVLYLHDRDEVVILAFAFGSAEPPPEQVHESIVEFVCSAVTQA